MLILTAGNYHYTNLGYTCDGDTPTDDERAEVAALVARLTDAGWRQYWTDDTGNAVLIIFRREAAADPEVVAAYERKASILLTP